MPWYSSKRATTVIADGEHTACIYHQTKVVRWNDSEIILDSAGYRSATTKARMNEVSEHYGLGVPEGRQLVCAAPWAPEQARSVPWSGGVVQRWDEDPTLNIGNRVQTKP